MKPENMTGYFFSYDPHPGSPSHLEILIFAIQPSCDAKSHSVTRNFTR
jgi:hypothetical protein